MQITVHVYSPSWRFVGASLFAISRLNLPAMLLAIVLSPVPVAPPAFFRTVLLFSVLPAFGAWVVARGLRGHLTVEDGEIRLSRPGLRVDIPAHAGVSVVPWRVPLPGPGFSFRTLSGGRLPHGVQLDDPMAALQLLGDGGAGTAMSHPTVVYAHAKAAAGRWRWYHLLAKFPLFALGPTAVLFNAHQHIAYGGVLGEYYLLGIGAYVQTFAIYWAATTVYCVLWAGVWRGLAEGASFLAAHVAPSHAARVRRAAELVCRVLYYGGVPVLLAIRFAPW